MKTEKRIFDLFIWILFVTALLILTSCNPYEGLTTPTQEPTVTATATQSKIPSGTADPSPTPQACTVSTGVPAGNLNIRTGAGTSYAVIRVLAEGETLTVIKRGAWLQVIDAQGNQGYINSTYCKIGE